MAERRHHSAGGGAKESLEPLLQLRAQRHRISTLHGKLSQVRLTPAGSVAANFAFDVTPARLVSGLITERGIATASRAGLATLYGTQVKADRR